MPRPPKYKTEEELSTAITEAFKALDDKKRMYSKAGVLYYLDICRDTWSEYRKKYPDTIKKTELLIEEDWVNRLGSAAATGAIFYLKNAFRELYRDRTETDLTSGGKPIPIYAGLSTHDLPKHDGDQKDIQPEEKD